MNMKWTETNKLIESVFIIRMREFYNWSNESAKNWYVQNTHKIDVENHIDIIAQIENNIEHKNPLKKHRWWSIRGHQANIDNFQFD